MWCKCQNSLLPPISLYKVNRGFVNQQILKMSSKKSWKGQMTSSALFNAADIFDWKFSFSTSSTKPAFSMTCMGCSLTWENTSVIPLLSQVFPGTIRWFYAKITTVTLRCVRQTLSGKWMKSIRFHCLYRDIAITERE